MMKSPLPIQYRSHFDSYLLTNMAKVSAYRLGSDAADWEVR